MNAIQNTAQREYGVEYSSSVKSGNFSNT